mmetsp:Transcript_73447/g.215413  ORF Transcript_73447/g.215413 Transcript_73447/m.215413 type:complete len:392 (+) Transcript_73447:1030-2205(+)
MELVPRPHCDEGHAVHAPEGLGALRDRQADQLRLGRQHDLHKLVIPCDGQWVQLLDLQAHGPARHERREDLLGQGEHQDVALQCHLVLRHWEDGCPPSRQPLLGARAIAVVAPALHARQQGLLVAGALLLRVLGLDCRRATFRLARASRNPPQDLHQRPLLNAELVEGVENALAQQGEALCQLQLGDHFLLDFAQCPKESTSVSRQQRRHHAHKVGQRYEAHGQRDQCRLEEAKGLVPQLLQETVHHKVGATADDREQPTHDGRVAQWQQELRGGKPPRPRPVPDDRQQQGHERRVVQEARERHAGDAQAERGPPLRGLLPQQPPREAVHDLGAVHRAGDDEEASDGDQRAVAESRKCLLRRHQAKLPHQNKCGEHDLVRRSQLHVEAPQR